MIAMIVPNADLATDAKPGHRPMIAMIVPNA